MHDHQSSKPLPSPLSETADTILPAASFLRYETRADGWSAGRQAAFLAHLADTGLVADAARSVGMSDKGGYALRRQARGYGFNLGWEAALIIARRIVADNLMAAAIQGETSRWVREEGVTTYTRQNSKLSLALLDRVNPALALPEVLAVVTQFDWFLELIDKGASGEQLWSLFFDATIPHTEHQARARVRASLQLSEESAIFDEMEEEEEEPPVEYKSMDAGGVCRPRKQPFQAQAMPAIDLFARRRAPPPLPNPSPVEGERLLRRMSMLAKGSVLANTHPKAPIYSPRFTG